MVRSGHRRVTEPNGHADRPRQDLDSAPRQLAPPCTLHPRLPLRREEWRVADADAAAQLGVSPHPVRKLIKAAILNSEQIMPDAPHQIRVADLASEQVVAALKQKGRPCRVDSERQISMFTNT